MIKNFNKIIKTIREMNLPQTDFVKFMEDIHDPFIVLIACILSLRTNDRTTYPATLRMLKLGKTPERAEYVANIAAEYAIELLIRQAQQEKKEREDHDEIMKKIEERNNAKKEKNYELADKIRNELLEQGIMLVDGREGTTYKEVE